MSDWRKELLADVCEGIRSALPIIEIKPGDSDRFFAYWPANGECVEILIPPGVRSPRQLPTAEQAIMQAVESLMTRAPIAGRA